MLVKNFMPLAFLYPCILASLQLKVKCRIENAPPCSTAVCNSVRQLSIQLAEKFSIDCSAQHTQPSLAMPSPPQLLRTMHYSEVMLWLWWPNFKVLLWAFAPGPKEKLPTLGWAAGSNTTVYVNQNP